MRRIRGRRPPDSLSHAAVFVLLAAVFLFAVAAGRDQIVTASGAASMSGSGVTGQQLAGLSAAPSPTTTPVTDSSSQASAAPSTPVAAAYDPRANCEPSATPDLYCVYTVQRGETLSGIASAMVPSTGPVSSTEILAASNVPDVVDANAIVVGQKLRIPAKPGVVHTVLTSESLTELAEAYGTSAEAIQSIDGNAVAADGSLAIGQVVLIPSPTRIPSQASADPEPTPEPSPEPTETPEPTPEAPTATPTPQPTGTRPPSTATPRPSATPKPGGSGPVKFIWPGVGPISSYFGPSHPLGIDIDFYANPNQPVLAAAAGKVTFAGGDPCCSYGYYVVIEHAGGFSTLYAHLSKINVKAGDTVAQGQTIGLGGSTGYATGNHLHFEVRLNGKVVNPLTYLP